MVPLGTLATVRPTTGPDVIYRYNRFRSVQLLGVPAPGYSSGQASDAMEQLSATALPAGYGYEWTGTTYQEKEARGHEGVIFGFAAVLVFLCLAALYESWSIPLAVLLALPLGLFGALAGRLDARLSVRHLHPDRNRDADRARRQERHPDRGVRAHEPRAREGPSSTRPWKRRGCGCGLF